MNQYGETPTYYIWPTGHEDGDPMPEDFNERVMQALQDAGFECESV